MSARNPKTQPFTDISHLSVKDTLDLIREQRVENVRVKHAGRYQIHVNPNEDTRVQLHPFGGHDAA